MTAANLRQYVVTLHRHEDLDAFYDDMETPGGDLYIPDRAVDVAKRRPLSRNTIYWLTAAEAEQVRQDSRVQAVELSLEEQDIRIEPIWVQVSNFFKGGFGVNADLGRDDKNWGLLRMLQGSDFPRHGYDDIKRMNHILESPLDGSNVDVVIVDGHIRPDHVEFQANVDGTGGSRVNQINWLSFAGAIGKTLPPPIPGLPALPLSYDYSSHYDTNTGDHGAMVGAIVAGNTQGWAKKANIYNISPYNETGMVGADDAMDYIKHWHQTIKTTNVNTGNKNPTVVNLSWGTYRYVNVLDITTIVYRGVTYNGPWTNTGNGTKTYQQLGFGYFGARQYFRGSGDLNYYVKISEPVAAWQADTDDLIAAGIHVIVAAGNDGLVQDVSGGLDYNNTVATAAVPGGMYYNRRSGPASGNAISVGSIDASSYAPGVDYYSNRGPAIDVLAPGSGIVTAVNRHAAMAGTVVDSRSLDDRITVGHGTSFAAPQIAGMLAMLLSDAGHQTWSPAIGKNFIIGVSKKEQLVDYEAPYDLAGTPNRYAYFKPWYITTTTTIAPTTTTTTSTSTTTTTSTSTTTTSTSTTSTTTLYYPPAQVVTIPFVCYKVPEASKFNIVSNVAWYSFSVASSITVVLNTLMSTPYIDTHIALYDSNGLVITENDDTGNLDLSWLAADLTPGTYWLAVGLFETTFNQRFRAQGPSELPETGICITGYDVNFPITTTSTTSTSTTTTSTSTTSTTSSTTTTTTFAPYLTVTPVPPGFVLQRTWCDNFVLWGLYKNQFAETFTGIVQLNSPDCAYVPGQTTTSSTSTTTLFYVPSNWDSTVTRLSILVNNYRFTKFPVQEPNYNWRLARGSLPQGVFISDTGNIFGSAIIGDGLLRPEQPAYVFNFSTVTRNTFLNQDEFRQYSISVITNGLLIPNKFLPVDVTVDKKSYQYRITSSYPVDESNNLIWRLRWGLLPPYSDLSSNGTISVTARSDIRPFQRREFLPPNFTDTSLNNDTTWETWFRNFLNRPHEFDYQFVVELSNGSGEVDSSQTIRIIHLKPPVSESWFSTNSSTTVVDPNRLYFILLTTEHDSAVWSTDQDLGSIDNGSISKKSITTSNRSGIVLKHIIEPNSNSRIPQGMKLQEDGLLLGRPSFRTHIDDPNSLPVNDLYEFSVRATVVGGKSYSTRRFQLKVNRVNSQASDNMYIRAFPSIEERARLEQVLTDTNIFPPSQIFRPTDPWFGIRRDIYIEYAMGLRKTPQSAYEGILRENHYNKYFTFGPVQNAVVLNSQRQIEYEIVYVTIVDVKMGRAQDNKLSAAQTGLVDLTSSQTYYYSQPEELDVWYYKNQNVIKHYTLSENNLYNMKNRILEDVGYVDDSKNLIPEWANSLQIDQESGLYRAPIGLVPVVVLAYVKPGFSTSIRVKLESTDFNFSRFEFDRYQLETYLSDYYDPVTQSYIQGQHTIFDGNTTVFDQESTRFIEYQEQYVDQHDADKYIKFPKTGVFR